MKSPTPTGGPRKDARSPEPTDPTLLQSQGFAEDHTADGGEFLDDALRMHEQTLSMLEEEDEE
ncbi:hypothetical protein [Dawidia soli]|uniref:Uncharacterized protein n=1 Tax=Dawidia soli TaxID=2782352 RepID=A0AAP2DFC7_9BACT|nr:hypothetical protein [Dawidia soli]MBT1690086.1 hypothetical protein [Dawidia soli]